LGLGFGADVVPREGGGEGASSCPGRRIGGLGNVLGSMPVVFTLYGPGGGLLSSSSASFSACLCALAGASASVRLGGGPKEVGSLSVESGVDWCSRAAAFGSLPLPIHPA
jgi:hypothetical protein